MGKCWIFSDNKELFIWTEFLITSSNNWSAEISSSSIIKTNFPGLGKLNPLSHFDTALSVTSSVYEVWTHKNSLTAKELTSSGYQVGKEIIGTTVNTLLFAYLGGSILLFAYVQTQQYNLEIILNSKFLFQDVAIMLSGAIACLFTVPVSIRCVIRQIHHATSETDHSWSDLFSQSLQIPWSISPLHCRRNPWSRNRCSFNRIK